MSTRQISVARLLMALAIALIGLGVLSGPIAAQSLSNSTGRDCQTIRTCQFQKGGSYRGCISAYSCRTCRFVPARCSIGSAKGLCREVRCGWGA